MRTIKILLAAGFLLVFGTSIHAQVQRNETYLPKFAIKTNALYWATSTPNLGIEVGLTTVKSNIGSFSRNYAIGSANVSTEVSSVCTDITEK